MCSSNFNSNFNFNLSLFCEWQNEFNHVHVDGDVICDCHIIISRSRNSIKILTETVSWVTRLQNKDRQQSNDVRHVDFGLRAGRFFF